MNDELRTSPQNIDAEKSVLGSMLISKDAVATATSRLEARDFYLQNHQTIFSAMLELYESNTEIDLITLSSELEKTKIEKPEGIKILQELQNSTPTAANVKYYSDIVKEMATRRKLLTNTLEIQQDIYDSSIPLKEIIEKSESQTFGLSQEQKIGKAKLIKEYIPDTLKELDYVHQHPGELPPGCIKTPFAELNNVLSIRKGDLTYVAGRPGIGKTSFVLRIAEYVALNQGLPVLVFSLEMGREGILTRLFAMHSKLDSHKINRGWIDNAGWTKITFASNKLAGSKLILCDEAGISPMFVKNESRRWQKIYPDLALIIVDRIGLMSLSGRYSNRNERLTVLSNSLKNLGRELNVPMMVVSQLNRGVESRDDKRPRLFDLRESGALEQDANNVLMIYREGYYNKEIPDVTAEIIIAKQTSGPTGLNVRLHWNKESTRFDNLEREEE